VRAAPNAALPTHAGGGWAVDDRGWGGSVMRLVGGGVQLGKIARQTLGWLLHPLIASRRQHAHVVEWVETTLELIAYELDNRRPGSDEIISRLTDILFVQIVRTYALSLSPGEGGWLGAIHDPHIARSLALIHDRPETRWTVAAIARQVGMSRSSFYERFTSLVGESPNRYLTHWRMKRATELMRSEDISTAALAEQVGYGSEDAFSRAFRRTLGVTPSAYRRQLISGNAST